MAEKTVRKVSTRKGVREYTWIGCPLTKNRTAWCFRLCDPDTEGKGQCGRLAPHALKSRTQRAIEGHNREARKAHIVSLEARYLASAEIEGYEPGVRIDEGDAEVVVHLDERHDAGVLPAPLCFNAAHDSAYLAVASRVRDGEVRATEFELKLTGEPAAGVVIARSLLVGMSADRYLTESILTDEDARDLGRATGTFTVLLVP